MTLRDRLAAANRLQRSRIFKIVATAIIALVAVGAMSAYVIRQTAPLGLEQAQTEVPQAEPDAEELTEQQRIELSALEAGQNAVKDVLRSQADWQSVAFGIGAVAAMAIAVVWLGLGLTYLALLALAAGVGLPALGYGPTATAGKVFLGIVALTASFAALLQLARLLLSHPGPVCSIARVVLDEAVRMKISLVFIVILIIGLSALPNGSA